MYPDIVLLAEGKPKIIKCTESNDFKIYTDVVTFNRKNETASSKTKSKFESEGAIIISNGFNITNQGDNINFNGKTSLTLN